MSRIDPNVRILILENKLNELEREVRLLRHPDSPEAVRQKKLDCKHDRGWIAIHPPDNGGWTKECNDCGIRAKSTQVTEYEDV